MTELVTAAGGQAARTRGTDTNEQRRRRLYRKKFSDVLGGYRELDTDKDNIIVEVIGDTEETGNLGIPDAIHLNPDTLAGAYYILHLLDISYRLPDDADLFIKRYNIVSNNLSEIYIRIALIKMTTREAHVGDRPILSGDEMSKIVDKIVKVDTIRGRNIRVAHEVDLFHYAIKVVNHRALTVHN